MLTLQDAKNRFSAVVDAALAGRPQEVSRRGKPAVVVVAAEDYARLVAEARARRESFADHLLAFPGVGGPEGGSGDGSGDFPRADAKPRDVSF